MFSFLRKTALWIIALPVLIWCLGLTSNQIVLTANHDKFPVMWNDYKTADYVLSLEHKALSKDSRVAEQARFSLEALREEGFLDNKHVLMTSDTHFNFLADWIDLGNAVYSIGDFLLMGGENALEYAPIIWVAVVIGKLRKKEDRY
jgi:hypothetical protein